jgi:hypothetical protein
MPSRPQLPASPPQPAAPDHGLARITTSPEPADYNLRQFLGDPLPTVPPVLTRALFDDRGGVHPTAQPGQVD